MTIRWVNSDPLVMNGEPFCYGTRLTVRNLLEMRGNGLTPGEMLAQHPELKRVGIAEAFRYATEHRERYQHHPRHHQQRGHVEQITEPGGAAAQENSREGVA